MKVIIAKKQLKWCVHVKFIIAWEKMCLYCSQHAIINIQLIGKRKMISKTAIKISEWCVNIINVSGEEKQTIQFGLEVLYDTVAKLILIMTVGLCLGKITEFMVFLLAFCSLRYWAGGIHCKSRQGCTFVMLLMCTIAAYGARYLMKIPDFFLVICLFVICAGMYFWAPGLTGKGFELNKDQIRRKRSGSCIWTLLACLVIYFIKDPYWRWVVSIAIAIEFLSIIPCRRKSKGG